MDEHKKRNATLICLARRRCNVLLAMVRAGQTYPSQAADLADVA